MKVAGCLKSITMFAMVLFYCASLLFAQDAADETNDYIHYRLGIKYKREKNYDAATEEFRKVLAAYPDNYNAYMHLAEISRDQGRPRLVIYNLKKALSYNPGWGKAHKMLAEGFESDGQFQKSIMELQLYQQTCDPAERDSVQTWINKLIGKVTGKNPEGEMAAAQSAPPPPADTVQSAKMAKKQSSEQLIAEQKSARKPMVLTNNTAAEAAFVEGVRLYGEQKWDESLKSIQQCLAQAHNHAGAYYYAGLLRRRLGQNKMAKYNFERSMSYPELGYNAHYYLGKICAEDRDFPAAIKHLEEYIDLTSYEEGKESARSLIELYKGEVKAAIPRVEKKPPVNIAQIGEGDLKKEVEKIIPDIPYAPLEIAIDSMLSMSIADTLTAPGQAMLAAVKQFKKGDYDNAIKSLRSVMVSFPAGKVTAQCLYDIGVSYTKMNLWENAENQFDQLLTRFPAHQLAPSALFLKGITHAERKNHQIAEKVLRDFIVKYPKNAWVGTAYMKLGDAYCDLHQESRAIDAYNQAAALGRTKSDQVSALFKLGLTYMTLGNSKMGLSSFEKAADVGEKNGVYVRVPDSYYKLADYWYKEKKYTEALALYTKVSRKYPSYQDTPWGLFQMGNCNKNLKKYKEAVDAYKGLIKQWPDDYWAKQAQWKLDDAVWENEYKAILQ